MNTALNNFRTYSLAKQLYKACASLKLDYVLKDQLNRATLSVVLNLAEGSAKRTIAEKRRFYDIAFGSLRESQAILELVGDETLIKQADQTAASAYKLIKGTVP